MPTSMGMLMRKERTVRMAKRTKGYSVFFTFQPQRQNLMSLWSLKQQYLNNRLNQTPSTPFTGGFQKPIAACMPRVRVLMMAPLIMKRTAITIDEYLSSNLGMKVCRLTKTMLSRKRESAQKLPVKMVHRKRFPKVVGTLLATMALGMPVKRSNSQEAKRVKQRRRVKKGILPNYYEQFIMPQVCWLFAFMFVFKYYQYLIMDIGLPK